jgi:hypothetical protein
MLHAPMIHSRRTVSIENQAVVKERHCSGSSVVVSIKWMCWSLTHGDRVEWSREVERKLK